MQMPKLLSPNSGDTVALLALSGPCTSREKFKRAITTMVGMGLEVHVMQSCYSIHPELDYLAGYDDLRLNDLHTAFADKNIKGIFAMRGGYGAGRLLPYINYDLIRKNPKVFVGYSDVTAMHIALNQFCDLVTFHGAMPYSDPEDVSLSHTIQFSGLQTLFPGETTGRITGGNLSVIASTLGTPYEIDTRRRILLLEEVGEPLYKIDRLLLQLKLAGKFSHAAGIIFGDFCGLPLEDLYPIIRELVLTEKKPTVWGLHCGHTSPNLMIPLGSLFSIRQI